MTAPSRRDFFRKFIPSPARSKMEEFVESKDSISAEHVLGGIVQFPVNTAKQVLLKSSESNQCRELQIEVESFAEGLRASCERVPEGKKYFGLSLNRCGQVIINLNVEWNRDSVLSILTGEMSHI